MSTVLLSIVCHKDSVQSNAYSFIFITIWNHVDDDDYVQTKKGKIEMRNLTNRDTPGRLRFLSIWR